MTMLACTIHGAKDLRLDEQAEPDLGPGQVRVRVRNGGICGSDLHYFFHGRIGDFVIREPFIPGHEFAGEVVEVGAAVQRVRPGERVAVHPGRSCGYCPRCLEGRSNLCQSVYFMGSASKFPHMQGGFRERVVVEERQCFPVGSGVGCEELAFAEPLAVAIHANRRAGPLLGANVLVNGAGPIGQLLLLVARWGGAQSTAAADVLAHPLAVARELGADAAFDVAAEPESLLRAARDRGGFDVIFESSGTVGGFNAATEAARVGGTIVQVGSLPAGPQPFICNRIMTKELAVSGSFRFDSTFGDSVACLAARRIDVRPLLSAVLPMASAREAFDVALDRGKVMKVQIAF
jgi:L-idonate 5-dehydrogenase